MQENLYLIQTYPDDFIIIKTKTPLTKEFIIDAIKDYAESIGMIDEIFYNDEHNYFLTRYIDGKFHLGLGNFVAENIDGFIEWCEKHDIFTICKFKDADFLYPKVYEERK